jgi:predicted PhzF superfamily epimerase YddE/YHI9
VTFDTASGPLVVRRDGGRLALRLPALRPHPAEAPAELAQALGVAPREILGVKAVHRATYWLAVYDAEQQIRGLAPDIGRLRALRSNVIVTAPGEPVDFVSRFFAPGSGVDEDPVTGSAHATLAPFWMDRLGKNPLEARQLSRRGGEVGCRVDGDAVWLAGGCALYLEGTVRL